MLNSFSIIYLIGSLVAIDILMRFAIHLYYADSQRVLRLLRLIPKRDDLKESYYKPLDELLAPFPFLCSWVEIFIGLIIAQQLNSLLGWCILVLWIGGRFRCLQEYGHNAVHYALCKSRPWQWWLSNFFFQFPAFKRDMESRLITHTKEHHRQPNHPEKDPNFTRVRNGGMRTNMKKSEFYLCLLFPLTFKGIISNLSLMFRNTLLNSDKSTVIFRCLSLILVTVLLYLVAGWKGIIFGWILPLITSYPLFAWLSLLTEHRWFIKGYPEERTTLEYHVGRPTDFKGFSGWFVRIFICPTSDAYHLAHSLYPGVRWNYLPAIDRLLKIDDPRYTKHISDGLLFTNNGYPSALSELYKRLTNECNSKVTFALGENESE